MKSMTFISFFTNIKNFIKDQFQESCFGSKSFNLMKARQRRAKSQCSSSPTSATTVKLTPTTSLTTSFSTSTTTPTIMSTLKSTISGWSWMPPVVTQYPAFQNVHLVNPVQFYPQTFQYKVTVVMRTVVLMSVSRTPCQPGPGTPAVSSQATFLPWRVS